MAGILDAFSKHGLFSEQLDLANEDPSTAHQMKGYDFAQNFPGAVPGGIYTPSSFIGPALSKGYQYGQELSRSMLDGLGGYTIADALEAAKTQSNANIEGMLGKGFNMDTYNQNLEDFNIKDVNFANSFSMPSFSSAAQASQIEQPQNLGFTSMVDMANNANNFNSQFNNIPMQMSPTGPFNFQTRSAPTIDRSNVIGEDIDMQYDNPNYEDIDMGYTANSFNTQPRQGIMQGLQNKIAGLMDFAPFGKKSISGMAVRGLKSIFERNPNAPSYQTRSPNIDYSNLNTNNLNDFYDSNPESEDFGTTRFDRATTDFGKSRTLAGYFERVKERNKKNKENKEKQAAIDKAKAEADKAVREGRAYDYAGRDNQYGTHTSTMTNAQAQANQDRGRNQSSGARSGKPGGSAGFGASFHGADGGRVGLASMFTRRR